MVTSNNSAETMTEQESYCYKCLEKGRRSYKENKERLKNDL